MADVIDALTDAKLALADAKEQQAAKDIEIDRLKKTIDDRRSLVSGDGGYKYAAGNNGAPLGFPVCPKCDQIDGRLIHLVQDGDVKQAKCPACATQYNPATCYFPAGGTLLEQRNKRRRQMNDDATRKMRAHSSRVY